MTAPIPCTRERHPDGHIDCYPDGTLVTIPAVVIESCDETGMCSAETYPAPVESTPVVAQAEPMFLPETGSEADFAVAGGILLLAGLITIRAVRRPVR